MNKIEKIKPGDIVLYDDLGSESILIKFALNVQRKQDKLPADTRLYSHSGVIIRKGRKLYQAQTNFKNGFILTPYKHPTGVKKNRVRILTPKVPLSKIEQKALSDFAIQLSNENIKYDKWSLVLLAIYLLTKKDFWFSRNRNYMKKLFCFEATAILYNHIRPYFKTPWKVTSLDFVYNENFRIKKCW